MLINRCPDLRDLVLDGSGFLDVDRIVEGVWPNLRTLTISYIGGSSAFAHFLVGHPTLRKLETSHGFRLEPSELVGIALPVLESFKVCGWSQDLHSFTFASFSRLQHLDLRQDPFIFHRWFIDDTCNNLQSLTELESLCVRMGTKLADPDVFGRVLRACPKILNFEVLSSYPLKVVSPFLQPVFLFRA